VSAARAETLVAVAVRMKSERCPKKALADLAGRPLLLRLIERVGESARADAIVVCTSTHPDDDVLAELCADNGIFCFRGHELDVLSRFLAVGRERGARTLVRVTGDNPLTDPAMMDHMIAAHLDAGAEYSYTDELPRGTRSEIMAMAALERCHALAQDATASEYLTDMIRRPDHFRVLRVPAPEPAWRRPEIRLTVDVPDDLAVVRAVYEAFAGAPPALEGVIAWLDAHPGVRDRNRHIEPRAPVGLNVRLKGD
jgi:spore coat polysaccharide biosynthesis protein SpsF